MQNNIFNYALKSGEINRNVLCEMCDQMEESMRKRFVEAILGIVNYIDDVIANIATTKTDRNGRVRTLQNYNYLQDRLDYTYPEERVRFFKNQEDADKYTETGDYNWGSSNYEKKEGYEIEAKHTFIESNYCTLYEWERIE